MAVFILEDLEILGARRDAHGVSESAAALPFDFLDEHSCLEELRATLEEGGGGVGRAVPILRAV